ncbi:MAG: hypothetical protein HY319_03200 [Armatimonadetes bacterium]|nr:hypothetical protein [Armatimonadota bacterium]
MNHHLRYVLPLYPFLFLFAARVVRWERIGRPLAAVCLLLNLASVSRVHPQELAYFNELVGGPENGHLHLLESNLDWGQDLLRLRKWLDEHPEARPLRMAYHNLVDPSVYGIEYAPAPFGPCPGTRGMPPESLGPRPGWFAISANLVMGSYFYTPDGCWGLRPTVRGAFTYFQEFDPVARPGWGLFVYHITPEQADRARRRLGLPPLGGRP